MDGWRAALGALPVRRRWTVVGAAVLGSAGAVTGLVIGLLAYAPTAWAAMFEVGVPAALLGGALGAVAGSLVLAARRPGR